MLFSISAWPKHKQAIYSTIETGPKFKETGTGGPISYQFLHLQIPLLFFI